MQLKCFFLVERKKNCHTNFADFAEQYSQFPQNCLLIPLRTVSSGILETNEKVFRFYDILPDKL